MKVKLHILLALLLILPLAGRAQFKIHVINVGQGNCIFVEGPEVDGKRVTMLFDGGKAARGDKIVEYLDKKGYPADDTTIDYMIVSHKDEDHFEGLINVLEAGYKVDKFYDNGSSKRQKAYDSTFMPLLKKQSQKQYTMRAGYKFQMGDSAVITCVIAAGKVIGDRRITGLSENDKSIGLFFSYKGFEFFSAGDLGGGTPRGESDCTHRSTNQKDLESPLLKALTRERLMDRENGIEVLHVSHHGSESSTNAAFMNGMSPSVAVISVGLNQSRNYQHPREDIVERVLMAEGDCINVEPALVLQTEDGIKGNRKTSFEGFAVGNIEIQVNGDGTYEVDADNDLETEDKEKELADLPKTFTIDKTENEDCNCQ